MSDISLLSLYIALIPIGFIIGTVAGYKYKIKKTIPLVKFVHTKDKEKVLKEYGVHLDDSAKCAICGDTITLENIGAVIPTEQENVFVFICSKSKCMTVSDLWRPIHKFKK